MANNKKMVTKIIVAMVMMLAVLKLRNRVFVNIFVTKTQKTPKSNESVKVNIIVPSLPPNTRYITDAEIKEVKRYGWSSPIVMEKYKLLFLPIEKNGCTQWKQLFHIMQNYSVTLNQLHDAKRNKLKYLLNMTNGEIRRIFSDPLWIKATVVREPRSRLLSGFFHMKRIKRFRYSQNVTFANFVYYVRNHPYDDVHWEPQARFPKWIYENMLVGKFENMREFGKDLLTKIGTWQQFGHTWGKHRNETLFSEILDMSNTSKETKKLAKYYTRTLEDEVFKTFYLDFVLFNYPRTYISNT